jgi:16S rRNA processing protein RimM
LADQSARRERLELGRFGPPHGLAGELKLRLHFAPGSGFAEASRIWVALESGFVPYEVDGVRGGGKGIIVKLRGVDDRTAAEGLAGKTVEVERALLPPLAEGEYYLADLVGAEVRGPDGPLGEVVAIAVHPTVDCVVVRLADGKTAEQPLSAPWLDSVDADEGYVLLSSLDGLIVG